MERYIGLDVHSASCTVGVLSPSGKRIGTHLVETSAKKQPRCEGSGARPESRLPRVTDRRARQ
jgi:hypothetical protein